MLSDEPNKERERETDTETEGEEKKRQDEEEEEESSLPEPPRSLLLRMAPFMGWFMVSWALYVFYYGTCTLNTLAP